MKVLTKKQTRHGLNNTPVYRLWANIVARVEHKEHYKNRGIGICEEWRNSPQSFCEWAMSNGYSKGLEIDRIDNEKGYSPENCQFITHKENCASGKRKIFKNNKTGHRNISLSKLGNYEVYLQVDGKQKYIGVRKSIQEAIFLRDKARLEIIDYIHDTPPCNT